MNDFMKDADQQAPNDAQNALIDSLLREHARLGRADDVGLLATIRARTTEKPSTTGGFDRSRRHVGAAEWLKVAAVVMVALGLLWLVLPKGPIFERQRPEHSFTLLVTPVAEPVYDESPVRESPDFPRPGREAPLDRPGVGSGHFELVDLDLDRFGLESSENQYSGYTDDFEINVLSAALLSEFSISAEKIMKGAGADRVVYEGNVILKHPDFELRADRIELAAASVKKAVGAFVATGDQIEVSRRASSGAMQSARAQQVTYDARGGSLILEGGPPTLSAGASYVVPQSVSGMIVLRPDGFQVIEDPVLDPEL